MYFSLGHGKDIVYHGKTEFRGIHENDILDLKPFQRQTFKADTVSQLYPEYYILTVNNFNKVAKTPLEEWIYYLNTADVPDKIQAPGLEEVRERLELDKISKDELKAYYNFLDNIVILKSNIYVAREEGRFEGREEAREEGRFEGLVEGEKRAKIKIVQTMLKNGYSEEQVAQLTMMSPEEVSSLIDENKCID